MMRHIAEVDVNLKFKPGMNQPCSVLNCQCFFPQTLEMHIPIIIRQIPIHETGGGSNDVSRYPTTVTVMGVE